MLRLLTHLLILPFVLPTMLNGQSVHEHYQNGVIYVQVAPGQQHQMTIYDVWAKQLQREVRTAEMPDAILNADLMLVRHVGILPQENIQRWYRVEFNNASAVDELLRHFATQEWVAIAELAEYHARTYTPNDYNASDLGNLEAVNARQAWDIHTGSDAGIIAMVDDAFYTSHEDISPNLWMNLDEIAGNGVDDDGDGGIDNMHGWDVANLDASINPPNQSFSHGTHTASCASAATDNGVGISALGFNSRLMCIKATADNISDGSSISHGYEGVQHAVVAGANVVNMSWGGFGSSSYGMQVVNAAAASDVVLVAAAGNDGSSQRQYPAAYDVVLAVGATRNNDLKANYSNYGNWIDVMAPGRMLGASSANSSGYYFTSGTSMASPMVAGLVALLRSFNSGMSEADVRERIRNTADNIDNINPQFAGQLGTGRINAFKALEGADPIHCDTIEIDPFTGDRTVLEVASLLGSGSGFLGGTNSEGVSRVAARFDAQPGRDKLHSIRLGFHTAVNASGTAAPELKLYTANNGKGAPSTTLFSTPLDMAEIISAVNAGDDFVYTFDDPFLVPEVFYIAIELPTSSSDSLGIFTSGIGDSDRDDGYWEYRNGTWADGSQIWFDAFELAVVPTMSSTSGVLSGDFDYESLGGNALRFTATATGDFDFFWDFGDGTADQGQEVEHTFASPGNYEVGLYITNGKCTYDTIVNINVTTSRAELALEAGVSLYPNPSDGAFTLEIPQHLSVNAIDIYDLSGRLVHSAHPQTSTGAIEVNAKHLANGSYLVKLHTQDNQQLSLRWLKH